MHAHPTCPAARAAEEAIDTPAPVKSPTDSMHYQRETVLTAVGNIVQMHKGEHQPFLSLAFGPAHNADNKYSMQMSTALGEVGGVTECCPYLL